LCGQGRKLQSAHVFTGVLMAQIVPRGPTSLITSRASAAVFVSTPRAVSGPCGKYRHPG
jgi:hypothetical protein